MTPFIASYIALQMVISFIGEKGGIGKTTMALGLACELVSRGKSVCLVDTAFNARLRQFAVQASEIDSQVPTIVGMGSELRRDGGVPLLLKIFEYVVIDTPARMASVHGAALAVADLAILPCGPNAIEIGEMSITLDAAEQFLEALPHLKVRILVNRKRAATNCGKQARGILESTGHQVLQTEISDLIDHGYAFAAGKGVTEFNRRSLAAMEMRDLCTEVEGLLHSEAREVA